MSETEATSSRTKSDPYIAMRFPEFRSYLAMRFLFTFAYQVQAVVVGWHIYQLTKDPLSLGLIGLAEAIPSIAVTLYGGYIADKSDKKKLMIWIILAMLLSSLILALVSSPEGIKVFGTEISHFDYVSDDIFCGYRQRFLFSYSLYTGGSDHTQRSLCKFIDLEQWNLAGCFHYGASGWWLIVCFQWYYSLFCSDCKFHGHGIGLYFLFC
jgi:MFS family permease